MPCYAYRLYSAVSPRNKYQRVTILEERTEAMIKSIQMGTPRKEIQLIKLIYKQFHLCVQTSTAKVVKSHTQNTLVNDIGN